MATKKINGLTVAVSSRGKDIKKAKKLLAVFEKAKA
jgi:hypothetical protein